MSGNRRSTTGSPCWKPSVSRSTTSPAILRSTRTSSIANVATAAWPLRRNIAYPTSGTINGRPQTVAVQLRGVHLHALASARGHHCLALVVHVHHQLLGLVVAVAEQLLEHPGHVRHEVDRIV